MYVSVRFLVRQQHFALSQKQQLQKTFDNYLSNL